MVYAIVRAGGRQEKVQVGDVVTAVGDRPVTSSTELTAAVRSRQPGDDVRLTVQRGGATRTVQVTLGATS